MRLSILAVTFSLLFPSPVVAQPLRQQSEYGEPNGTFPNWQERAFAQLSNRARAEPSVEMASCPAGRCLEGGCYSAAVPLYWTYDLNQAARFHSASLGRFPFFSHDTPCTLFSDINTRYPGTSNGSFASSCSASGTTTAQSRVLMFGPSYAGENIVVGSSSPHDAFYVLLHEQASTNACGFTFQNGHRYNILTTGTAVGVGFEAVAGSPWGNYWTQDFGSAAPTGKIPSGSHWTAVNRVRDATVSDNSVEFWANWYDPVGGAPNAATVVLDNVLVSMVRSRGTNANGAWTATIAGVSTACHTYYFSFIDSSLNAVRYPTIGSLGFGAGCPDYSSVAAPAAPAGVTATAASSTQVGVSWSAVVGATSYEIYRRDPGGAYALRGTTASISFNDAATANTAYLYRVRAVNAGGSSPDSAADLATTVMFTDDPLVAGVVVMAVHLAELRTTVNAVRAQTLLGVGSYTDSASAGVTIKAVHVIELRSQLDAAMNVLGLSTGAWTDGSLSGIPIRAVHFQEIRNRVQ